MRRIIVGDVQGCCTELEDLLHSVRFDPASDRLYSVGDVVNRGPDSARAVRLLRQLDAVAVLGNHELHYFETLAGRRRTRGRDTMGDLLEADDRDELTDWLAARPLLHLEDDLVLVHAALSPAWVDLAATAVRLRQRFAELLAAGEPLEDPDLGFAVSARYCDAAGRRSAGRERPADPADPAFRPWDDFYRGPRQCVFGHWAQRGLVVGPWVRGLDTGCVYGKQLTAYVVEENRLVHVPARRAWCPIE